MLSTKLHIPINRLDRYPILFHGDWGTFKTTTAAQYEKSYFMMYEANNEYPLFRSNITSWEQNVEAINDFLYSEHPHKTVILDNIDRFYDLASQFFVRQFNKQLPKGKEPIINLSGASWTGYDAVDAIIGELLNPLLMSSKYSTVLIAHSEMREITTFSGDVFHKITPQLPNKRARKYFLTAVSNIFYFYKLGKTKSYIRIAGNDFIIAKNRSDKNYPHFKTTSGEDIINIPCGKNPEETYRYIQAAYQNKLKNSYKDIDS